MRRIYDGKVWHTEIPGCWRPFEIPGPIMSRTQADALQTADADRYHVKSFGAMRWRVLSNPPRLSLEHRESRAFDSFDFWFLFGDLLFVIDERFLNFKYRGLFWHHCSFTIEWLISSSTHWAVEKYTSIYLHYLDLSGARLALRHSKKMNRSFA